MVKIIGIACGIGIEGSGWFATPDLVVTAAHVVAGEHAMTVAIPDARTYHARRLRRRFDPRNDVAVLRVLGATATPLRDAEPTPGTPVAIVGYPDNGPLTADAGTHRHDLDRIHPRCVRTRARRPRTITAVAGRIRHGNSGGPAVDARGVVRATIFAASVGSPTGYGVPPSIVEAGAAASAQRPVSTGSCARLKWE